MHRGVRGDTWMRYNAMSSDELFALVKEWLPELEIDEVNDLNRETVIACLKVFEEDRETTGED